MDKFLDKIIEIGTEFGGKLLVSICVLVIGLLLIKLVERLVEKFQELRHIDNSAREFITSFITAALKIMLVIIILAIMGVPMASIITVIGSCAITIGLALQGGLSNLAGGLMILLFKPFKSGDYIEVEGKEGTVKSISLFYTRITTVDNRVVEMPNGKLTNSNITNYTANKKRKVNVTLSVSYNSDIDKVKKVIRDVIDKSEYALKDEDILIGLNQHNASSLDFIVRYYVDTENYLKEYLDFMEKIKKAFDKNKIEIPYNQLDVHIDK